MKISISVIIPSYNSARTISYTLNSLFNLPKAEFLKEIIVVDSSDDKISLALLKEHKKNYTIKLIHFKKRTIAAEARNIGAGEAKGEILAFIDADAFVERNWLKIIKENYQKGVKLASGSILLPDFQKTKRIAVAEHFLEFNEFMTAPKRLRKKIIPSCNMFCDKKLFIKLGGFPVIETSLLFKSEDVLFSLKASRFTDVYFIPELRAYHICRDTFKKYLKNQMLLGYSNLIFRSIAYKKNVYYGLVPLFLIPFIMIVKAFRILRRILKTKDISRVLKFFSVLDLFMLGLISWGWGFGRASFSKGPRCKKAIERQ